MPEICRFNGAVVRMYYREHPPPHFHVRCGDCSAVVDITTGRIDGDFPSQQRRLVLRWYSLHRSELLDNWNRASRSERLRTIEPLE